MAYLVVLVLNDLNLCSDLLDAWEEVGARGVTIIESTGIGRIRKAGVRDDLPLIPSLADILRGKETHNRTMFSVVDSEKMADTLIQAAKSVVGDFDEPNTGLLFVFPLTKVVGLSDRYFQE